ncbi:MAG TPA: PAS domain-containing protein [Ramlibacter sp.]|uniref:PAS domain-containing protein n=1 Tax=Ramlibacter sp. TaxID=1917967 RepID=UPI002ED2D0C1
MHLPPPIHPSQHSPAQRPAPDDAAASHWKDSVTLTDRPADASSRRAALIVVALSTGVFLALAPLAKMQFPPAAWFIPLFQSVLIINDLVTAALLFGQLRLTRAGPALVLASGYVFGAIMATLHLLSFPGVFTATGLLGGGAQTTAYLHVFWHLGMPVAVVGYALLRERGTTLAGPTGLTIGRAVGVVVAITLALALITTWGNDLLPPLLAGNQYSSAFNIGRYGQWVLTALALLFLWQRRRQHSVLDLWLMVMLCNTFFEIALVSIVNAGRFDLGFYAGRVYATVASSVVLLMLLGEHWKIYRELAAAQETARSEAALRESREVLGLAMHGGRMAAWTRDLAAHTSWWSPEVEELTGWPAEALAASDSFLVNRVHPEDRVALRGAMDASAVPGEEFAVEFRLRHADGGWHWLDARGQVRLDEEGRPTRLFGVVVDISDRKQAEEAAAELEQRFRTLADEMPQQVWMARPDGQPYWYNRRWYEYTGTSPDQMEGAGWQGVLDPDTVAPMLERWRHSIATGEPFEMVFGVQGSDGVPRPFLSRAAPVRDSAGRILNWFGTNTDISQQRAEEEALRIADRRKDEFLATLAHELRNPLAPIRNAVELMKRAGALPAMVTRSRDIMDRQSRHLSRLVDDLLEVSRITQGKLMLHREKVSLLDCVHDAVNAARPAVEAAGHHLEVHADPDPLLAEADATRIAQAVVNLVNNAAKFTPRGGRIVVSSWRDGDNACVCVADNGIGIAPEHLGGIFGMFSQVQSARERSHGGLGIGLALVRGFVELHGGSVRAHSGGTGKGSKFTIRLPLLPGQVERAVQAEAVGERAKRMRRVLVVDDNEDAAHSLASLLSQDGHEVRLALGGEEGLRIAFAFEPEVVLLDIGMPGMNGLEVARELRRQVGWEVRIIAVTGWGQARDRELTREAGFDFHLTKPVDREELEALLLGEMPRGPVAGEGAAVQRH